VGDIKSAERKRCHRLRDVFLLREEGRCRKLMEKRGGSGTESHSPGVKLLQRKKGTREERGRGKK